MGPGSDAFLLMAGALGCVACGLLEFRLNTAPTLFRLYLRSLDNKSMLKQWTPYLAYEGVVGIVLALPLIYWLPSDGWWKLVGPLIALAWSPAAARSRLITAHSYSKRSMSIGLNGPYGWLRDKLRSATEISYRKVSEKWLSDQRKAVLQGGNLTAVDLAREIREGVERRSVGRKLRKEMVRCLEEMDEVATDPSARLSEPQRYGAVSRIALELGRAAVRDASAFTAAGQDGSLGTAGAGSTADGNRVAQRTLWATVAGSAIGLLGVVVALAIATGFITVLLPGRTTDPEPAGRVRLGSFSVEPSKVAGDLVLRVEVLGGDVEDATSAECLGRWRLIGNGDGQKEAAEGSIGDRTPLGRSERMAFSDSISVPKPVELGRKITLELAGACTLADGTSVESKPETYLLDTVTAEVTPVPHD